MYGPPPFQPAARRVVRQAPPASGDRKISELVEKVAPLADADQLVLVDSVTGDSMRVSLATLTAHVAP